MVPVQRGDPQSQKTSTYLLKMPPKSEALRHSGGERRLFTSAMVTLYLEVELRRDKRPGTEQNKSVGLTTQVPPLEEKAYCILMTAREDDCMKDSSHPALLRIWGHMALLPSAHSSCITSRSCSEGVLSNGAQGFVFQIPTGHVYNRVSEF